MNLRVNKGLNKDGSYFAVPWDPFGSNSLILLDVFPMIASGLRDFTQKSYSGSSGLVCLNVVLIVVPFARAHSGAIHSWSVTPVNLKMSSGV